MSVWSSGTITDAAVTCTDIEVSNNAAGSNGGGMCISINGDNGVSGGSVNATAVHAIDNSAGGQCALATWHVHTSCIHRDTWQTSSLCCGGSVCLQFVCICMYVPVLCACSVYCLCIACLGCDSLAGCWLCIRASLLLACCASMHDARIPACEQVQVPVGPLQLLPCHVTKVTRQSSEPLDLIWGGGGDGGFWVCRPVRVTGR